MAYMNEGGFNLDILFFQAILSQFFYLSGLQIW